MSKRVSQLEIFLAGFRDASDNPANGHIVKFYTADQTYATPKNAWTTKDKSAVITSVTLDANGRYTTGAYFAGGEVYDLRLFQSDGTTVVRSYDDVKVPETTQQVRTVTATSVTATIDDDVILCDTTSNAITVNLYPVADAVSDITIKNIGTTSNSETVDGDGSELIDGCSTDSISVGLAKTYNSDGSQWYATEGKTTGRAFVVTGSQYSIASTPAGGNVNTWSELSADSYDEGGWFNSSNPTRLTVPSGVTRVRVGCTIKFTPNASSYRGVWITEVGSLSTDLPSTQIQAVSVASISTNINLASGAINVSPSTYFEVFLVQESGSALGVTGNFWIEAVT
jgi:hypothetical protein